ncbi:probable cytochrome P450 305a1 [Tribolium madens]|uniref:probable cytochrome P450 305a1 n=1 Tax=Tribolium madens TaxID=41895 RepID=UPI001CF73A23|nr:probable cytochrome P450 305a1 [Tribolium madens]
MWLAVILFFIFLATYVIQQVKKPLNFPPGPYWLPFVGNLPQLKKLSKSLGGQHLALSHLAKEYDTNVLGLKLGNDYVVTVFTYPLIRDVLISEEFEGRPDNFFLRLRCMGKKRGITCTEGEEWNTLRNFVNRHLRSLGFGKKPMEKMIQAEICEILAILKKDGSDIQVDKFLAPCVLSVIWTLITGEKISRENNQLDELLDLFNLRSKAFDMTGGTLTQYPWLRHFLPDWSGFNLIKSVNASLKNLFMKYIQEHKDGWFDGRSEDLIYRYITEMKTNTETSKYFTDDHLVMVCVDLFIGGAQTTSRTLGFAFLMMIMFPEVQKKVQEQIDKHFDKDSPIQYSDRYKLPYVEAVLLETIRYRYVVPIGGPRRVTKDTTLNGYYLPKNTTVLISFYSINNDPEYWQNPESFNPERFLDEKGSLLPDEKLIPFALGRRRCVGEVLAKNCIFLLFVEILRRYNVSLAPGSKPPTGKPLPGITLSPESYRVKFTERLL